MGNGFQLNRSTSHCRKSFHPAQKMPISLVHHRFPPLRNKLIMIFPTKITTNWDHTIPNHPDVPKENHQKRHSISDAADLGRRCPAPASTVVAKDSADEERTMRSSWTPKKNVGITGASILISQIYYHVYDLTLYIYIHIFKNWYTNIDMSVFIIVMMLIWDMYTCVYIYMLSEIKCD